MLTEFTTGAMAWKTDVAEVDGAYVHVPKEVKVVSRDRGMISYVNENGGEWMWYPSQFFHTREECEAECKLLELESAGVVTERMQKMRDEFRALIQRAGLIRILP